MVDAEIGPAFIVYSDGRYERADGQYGAEAVRDVAQQRQAQLFVTQKVIGMGETILKDVNDFHPALTMIHSLEMAGDPNFAAALDSLKKPQKRMANEREFISENEREYLAAFIKDQRLRAAVLSQNQIKEAL